MNSISPLVFRSVAVILAVCSLAAQGGSASAQSVYVVGNSAQFGYFDLTTRQYTQVAGSISGLMSTSVQGLAYNAGNNTTNLITRNDTGFNAGLYRIQRGTGAATRIGTVNDSGFAPADLDGLTYSPSGTLYTYFDGNDRFATINPTNASATQLSSPSGVSINAQFRGKLAFSSSSLYAALTPSLNPGLYVVDATTGAATFRGNGGQPNTYTAMILFGNASNLYGINQTTLYQVNTTNGNLTNLGAITGAGLPSEFVAGVFAPSSFLGLPEPSSLLLAGIAGLMGVALRHGARRRTGQRA